MNNIKDTIRQLTPDVIERFKQAIETGKWPNGDIVTPSQRETCMEAVLVWEYEYLPENERTGYIDRGTKKEDETCASDHHEHDDEATQIIQIRPS